MALVINSNISSLTARNNLAKSTRSLGAVYTRLSTGLRINRARDDAASLAIVERLTSDIRGSNIAQRTINDANAMAQTAEGALGEMSDIMHRMRDLAVQAQSDALNSTDRLNLDVEFEQLKAEVQRIATTTAFNGKRLLTGAAAGTSALSFRVDGGGITGARASGIMKLSVANASNGALSITASIKLSFGNAEMQSYNRVISRLDKAINSVSSRRAYLGAMQSRFESALNNVAQIVENESFSRSQMLDADIATETAELTKLSILQQAGTAILAQANQQPQLALQLLG
jgi:flagellin